MTAWRSLMSFSSDDEADETKQQSKCMMIVPPQPEKAVEEQGFPQMSNSDQTKRPVEDEMDGPAGWIERLRAVTSEVFKRLGRQSRPFVIGTVCRGSGCPTLALKVGRAGV